MYHVCHHILMLHTSVTPPWASQGLNMQLFAKSMQRGPVCKINVELDAIARGAQLLHK